MTKVDLTNKVSERTGLYKKDVRECIDACLDVIVEAMKNNETVQLQEFGKFTPAIKEERKGVRPATGEAIMIPRHRVMKFFISEKLRKELYEI